ncbi:MAG: class I SAM-dependent methyltransferase [Oscillospiraceae bacterium]|nr:class I SAM-dependent methyltransferase [Oscillospiraceae bacterium]
MDDKGRGADFRTELQRFQKMWDNRGSSVGRRTAEKWNERAEKWIDELGEDDGNKSMMERVRVTAEYLRARGLLRAEDTVVDVGCGPGLFVMEFAKTAKRAVGIDFSERFVEYGNALAISQGVDNVSFERHDMITLDVDAAKLSRAFDLVFTSITPAMTGKGVLPKLMKMSRAMCCNISFVHVGDSLLERVSRDVFGGEVYPRHDGMGFYTLLNLLLLSGYYPETYYYTIETNKRVKPDLRLAEDIAVELNFNSAEDINKILSYLEKVGEMERQSISRYGSILWDTRIRDERGRCGLGARY